MRWDAGKFLPVHEEGAFIRLEKARNHPQEGGFAASGGTQEGDEFAAAYIQVDVFQYFLVTEGFGKVLDFNDFVCFAHFPNLR